MNTAEEQKQFIIDKIMSLLTVNTDEAEGQQTINLSEVNICNSDYINLEEPYYTPEDIMSLLHLDDPNVTGKEKGDGSDNNKNNGYPGDTGDGITTPSSKPSSLVGPAKTENDNLPNGNDNTLGIDNSSPNKNKVDDNIEHNKYNFDMIAIPDSVNMDDIVQAILEDKNPATLNHAVIEFATPSLQDKKGVDYQLYVKPGQKLTADTIIGTVTMDGCTKPIRSIFEDGTVLATPDGQNFKHLYEGAGANRHIIIEDFAYAGEVPEVNLDVIDKIKAKFEREAQLNQLITDNLCESVLPWILLRRYTSYKYIGVGFLRIRIRRDNGREIFSKYLKMIEGIRKQYLEDMKNLGTEDNIKATNGSIKKIKNLGDIIIGRRDKYLNDIVYAYKYLRETLDYSEYDPDYSDCKYLAYVHGIKEGDEKTNTYIGDIDYNNYYMGLLSKIDLSTGNPYALEYYEILKEIVEIRISREVYSLEQIALEFNTMFNKVVARRIPNPYLLLLNDMRLLNKSIEYSDIINWMTNKVDTSMSNEYTSFATKQLANMFLFCWNYKTRPVNTERPSYTYTTYENETFDISEEFYWSESPEYPYGLTTITKNSFENIPDGNYVIGPTNGKYSINIDGVTCWLKSKNKEEVIIAKPKLTQSVWDNIRANNKNNVNNIYELVAQEWNKISAFWEKVIAIKEECKIQNIITEFTDVANSVSKYASWPAASLLTVGYDTYDHYLFQNGVEIPIEDDDFECGLDYDTTEPIIPDAMEAPPDPPRDFILPNEHDPHMGEITPKDFNYWQRYFAMATIISIPYLNCGIDIPPFVMMIPLPCIFICIAAVYIQPFDITMVFGLSIRGMYIWPIILFVNLSNQHANIMTPLIAQIKTLISQISAKINALAELPMISLANGFINMLENDNRNLRNQNKQLEVHIAQIKQKTTANAQKIKKNFTKALKKSADTKQQVVDPMKKAKEDNG